MTDNREALTTALAGRRARMMTEGQIDNASLYAGSPMYYYCKYCGVQTDVLPEGWWAKRPSHICADCQTLIDLGWHDRERPVFPQGSPL